MLLPAAEAILDPRTWNVTRRGSTAWSRIAARAVRRRWAPPRWRSWKRWALRGLAGRGVTPVFGGGARQHDRQVAAPARADPAATPSVPSQEDCRGWGGF